MTRAKSKRAGTRGGGTNVGKKPTRAPLPDDLAEAAEAALDDLLGAPPEKLDDDDEPGTRARRGRGVSTHEVSLEEIIPLDEDVDVDVDIVQDEPLTRAKPRRLPSRVAPLASTVTAQAYKPPATLDERASIDATNPVDPSDVEELEDLADELGAAPLDDDEPPTGFADRQRGRAEDDDEPPTGFADRQRRGGGDELPSRTSSSYSAAAPSRISSPHAVAVPSRLSSSHDEPAPQRTSSSHAVATPGRTSAHTVARTSKTPPPDAPASQLPPEDTSAHTVARDDAGFPPSRPSNLPTTSHAPASASGAARTPTPQPSSRPSNLPTTSHSPAGRAPLPPPSGSASGRSSVPSVSRLPLPAPADTGVADPETTLEATTSRQPGKDSIATIDMQNAKHGQLTRETKTDEADARRAWLESAKFDGTGGAPQFDVSSLDHVDLDSEPFQREDDSLDHVDLDSAPYPKNESTPFAQVDDALAGLESDRGASQSGEERALHEVPALRFAVYEDSAYLSSAQNAIVAAGHVVAAAGAGRDALKRVGDLIRTGSIDVVLVSLPGGESIIDAALSIEPRRPTIIASLSASSVEAVSAATLSGADLATTRPHDVERIAPLALAAARIDAERRIAASAKSAEQVLRERLEDIAEAEPGGLLPFEMFQRVLELEIKRAKRFSYPLSVALFALEVAPPPPPAGIRGILRARAGNALINTIRDIDIATQLDHERFLVLLPYTDLKGAAAVGKRVIGAVAKLPPITSDGRQFPPRVVGACAGMKKGEPVSFAKLMKDATRALESARRDGADLAVQP